MKHCRSIAFKRLFKVLPLEIQELAKKQYALLKTDPSHPSVAFKPLKGTGNYSARVNQDYRALGTPIEGSEPTVIVGSLLEPIQNTITRRAQSLTSRKILGRNNQCFSD